MTVRIPMMGVLVPKSEGNKQYSIYGSYESRLGYFLLKKSTFDMLSETVARRLPIRNGVMAEIKEVMGLDEKGRPAARQQSSFAG
ncbi:MAG: hypothetical protein NTX79_02495 [Candidatus Micrarchaeota archaeon]|nr:hypothetical protein [Candidatus Micrarchaeota archaeon]